MSQIHLGHSMHSSYQEFVKHGHGKFGPWFDLVNSEEWDTFGRRTDHFQNPAWLPFFLHRWNFAKPRSRPFPISSFHALRVALRAISEAAAKQRPIAALHLRALNQAMNLEGKRQIRHRQNGFAVEFVSDNSGWSAILSETAHSFAALLSAGELSRIRLCRNPLCRWVFYDQTKAQSRCWCDDKICGNRERVRRARARASR